MSLGLKHSWMLAGLLAGMGVLAACSDDSRSSSGGGGDGGTSGSSTSSSSSSSGMGTGGMGTGGMGSSSSSSSSSSGGMNLAFGTICNQVTPCPMNQNCLVINQNDTNGFCSIECTGAMDTTTCAVYMGPGKPVCNIQVPDPAGNKFYCNLACGDQYMLPTDCPMGMTCQDRVGPNMMPDGKLDSCTPTQP